MIGWSALSIRTRLVAQYTLALVMVLVPFAAASYVFVRGYVLSSMDEKLVGEAEEAVLIMSASAKGPTAGDASLVAALDGLEAVEDVWYELWSVDGGLVFRDRIPAHVTAALPPMGERSGLSSIRVAGGERLRVVEQRVEVGGRPLLFRVVASAEGVDAALWSLLRLHAIGLIGSLLIAGVFGHFLARRVLAPVRLITDRARLITPDRLGEGIPVVNPSDELGKLALTFNEMFARLDTSLRGLREFTADASHELRTPLAAIRNVAEVGLGRDEAGKRESLESILEEIEHMTGILEGLLSLARAENHRMPLSSRGVDLVELSREVVQQLGVLAEERSQELRVVADTAVQVYADRMVLRQALMNVIDNAIKHGREGTPIEVRLAVRGSCGTVTVTDQGPGIPFADRARVFDRFYRADAARSRAMGGSGLGLAIAAWGVRANGGSIELESEEGRGSSFRIVLPSSCES